MNVWSQFPSSSYFSKHNSSSLLLWTCSTNICQQKGVIFHGVNFQPYICFDIYYIYFYLKHCKHSTLIWVFLYFFSLYLFLKIAFFIIAFINETFYFHWQVNGWQFNGNYSHNLHKASWKRKVDIMQFSSYIFFFFFNVQILLGGTLWGHYMSEAYSFHKVKAQALIVFNIERLSLFHKLILLCSSSRLLMLQLGSTCKPC